MLTAVLTLSLLINFWLFRNRRHTLAALYTAERGGRMYRRLKSRLNLHLERWERDSICENCREYNCKHRLDCPSMAIRFAITKAEQE